MIREPNIEQKVVCFDVTDVNNSSLKLELTQQSGIKTVKYEKRLVLAYVFLISQKLCYFILSNAEQKF